MGKSKSGNSVVLIIILVVGVVVIGSCLILGVLAVAGAIFFTSIGENSSATFRSVGTGIGKAGSFPVRVDETKTSPPSLFSPPSFSTPPTAFGAQNTPPPFLPKTKEQLSTTTPSKPLVLPILPDPLPIQPAPI